MNSTPQFGNPLEKFTERPGAYAVLNNSNGQLLTVFVRGRYHLPGGGIDRNEDPLAAVIREVKEETGYQVSSLKEIGRANQFLETKDLGPINKLGTYFYGSIEDRPLQKTAEADHQVMWIDPEEFINSSAHDFHKWAVRKAFK